MAPQIQGVSAWVVAAVAGLIGCLGLWASAADAPAAVGAAASAAAAESARKLLVFIGGRGPKGGAIYQCRLNLATGEMTEPKIAAELPNPSFQVIHPTGKYLYSVIEAGQFEGAIGGGVAAFALNASTGELTALNQQASGGSWPCHISLDSQGKWLLGANYGGGNIFVMPIGGDGKLGERTCLIQHEGRSINKRRQEGPHAHSINLDAPNRFAFAADLGADKVFIYRFDPAKGTLTPAEMPFVAAVPGAGPRHFAFHPNGKFAYVINELNCTITVYTYDAEKGAMAPIQAVPTLPKDFEGNSTCAEIQVHPSGKFLYGSNRGHESIAMFAIDGQTGRLSPLGQEPTQGTHPRNFRIDPTGSFLLVANRDTNDVVVFRIDGTTGKLKATGQSAKVPGPNCVKFLPAP